jgi:hypothetical protein
MILEKSRLERSHYVASICVHSMSCDSIYSCVHDGVLWLATGFRPRHHWTDFIRSFPVIIEVCVSYGLMKQLPVIEHSLEQLLDSNWRSHRLWNYCSFNTRRILTIDKVFYTRASSLEFNSSTLHIGCLHSLLKLIRLLVPQVLHVSIQ